MSAVDESKVWERYEAATAELDRMTSAPGGPGASWRWSIPARPERDSDLILDASIRDVPILLAALKAARGEVAPHVCEDCQTCGVHGNDHLKCCGCYDGACCQASTQPSGPEPRQ